MLRVAVVSLIGLAALPAAASAALPAPNPPPKTVAGVKLTWPVQGGQALLSPGTEVAVKVRSSHRRATISLVHADTRGIPDRTVARRVLRSGTVKLRIPYVNADTYQLRAVVAGKRYFSWITTTPPLPAKPPPPAPTFMDVWKARCPAASTPQYMQLATDTAHPGDTVTYTLSSPGGSCLSGGVCSSLQRQLEDGTWTPVDPRPCPAMAEIAIVEPGATSTDVFVVPPGAPPGVYRYVYRLSYFLPDGGGGNASATFTVTPA